MSIDQCSRCDAAADCIDNGMTRLEDVADVLGVPTPSMHVHLVQHDRDDLLRRLTYAGEPILPPIQSNDGQKDTHTDTSVDEWPEGTDPQELVDAGVIDPDQVQDTDTDTYRAPSDIDMVWLYELAEEHPDSRVRAGAQGLAAELERFQEDRVDRMRLEQLVAQRDHLNDEIDRISQRLGDLPRPDAQAAVEKDAASLPSSNRSVSTTPAVTTAEIRTWCIANGIDVPSRGTLPHHAIYAYREAHEGIA